MSYLLDTHTFLYAFDRPEALGARARDAILDSSSRRFVSVISFWEIAIKVRLGKLILPTGEDYYWAQLQALNAALLPVEARHCFPLFDMALHHKDPFDRMLIAQAKADGLTILTQDRAFGAYGVPTLW